MTNKLSAQLPLRVISSLLLVIYYLWKRSKSKMSKNQWIVDLCAVKQDAIDKLTGVICPQPKFLLLPWYALKSFVKVMKEHRHLHFLHDIHKILGIDSFVIPLPMQPTYIITVSPANVEHILKTEFNNFVKGEPFFIARMKDLLGNGIFNADGQRWHHQRKTASQMFTQKKLTNHIWRVIGTNTDKVVSLLHDSPAGSTVDIFQLMNRFTLDTIGEIGFARSIGALENADSPFLKSFDRAQQIVFQRMVLPFWRLRKMLRLGEERDSAYHFKLLQDYSLETVRDLKANLQSERGDSFVGLFMQDAERSGSPYDEALMRDMVLNFLIAGRDTTAQALSWALYLILDHPEVETKILDEIAEVCGDAALIYDDMNRLPFLQAVINETLRLYPSVPMDAKLALDDSMLPDGTFVTKGDVVVYNIFGMGRSRALWGEDADLFRPDRWLGTDFPSLYTYAVFNAGPRECLGKRLAWVEMKACLVQVLRSVKLTLAVPRESVHYDVQLTLGMSSGLPCKVEPR